MSAHSYTSSLDGLRESPLACAAVLRDEQYSGVVHALRYVMLRMVM